MATKKNTKFTDHSGNKWVISAKPRKKKKIIVISKITPY
jgi:hypothetical protein|tara:strand:- start:116 stop:232 length:117 start_codon:yes stop_codon:yes gene_type:complete